MGHASRGLGAPGLEAEDGKIPAEFVELMEATSERPEERTALALRWLHCNGMSR
jgi:hypothetical protein